MEKVYVVLLNYNGSGDTIECLESLLKSDYGNYQIIVVDNSESTTPYDNLIAWAKGDVPQVPTKFERIVYPLVEKPVDYISIGERELLDKEWENRIIFCKAEQNKGFAAGNNVALQYVLRYGAGTSFAWLLNNDTVVEKQTMAALVNCGNTVTAGLLGSRLLYYSRPDEIQAVGGKFRDDFFISLHVGEGSHRDLDKEAFGGIDYVIGASMFVKHKFLTDVGLLSEDYFLYYEELDWTYRARQKGWGIDWCSDAVVYHKEGASIGSSYRAKKSLFSEKEVFRSRRIFTRKFYGLSFKYYLTSLLLVANRVRKGNFKAAAAVARIAFTG